jgi:2-C-methyl-D-erythritol 4-phosphate cytidylyltransferase
MLSAIIVAAGKGERLKAALSKPLIKIGKFPVICYSLRVLNKHPQVNEIIVVANQKNRAAIFRIAKARSFKKVKAVVLGGILRQDSVYNGLKAVSAKSDWVLIHDAARPFINLPMLTKVIAAARRNSAAIVGVRPKATIKVSRRNNLVERTLNRDKLWEIQTPQVFKKGLILAAYKKHASGKVTDDASLIEKLGKPVELVEGSYENIKITTAEDLLFAGLIAKRLKNAF